MGIMVIFLIIFACLIAGAYLSFKVYNSAEGERYTKQRMQGPFVPIPSSEDAEDSAANEARVLEKSVDFSDVAESLKQRGKI